MAKQVINTFVKYNAKRNTNETYTLLRCDKCGAETSPKGVPGTKRVDNSIKAECHKCGVFIRPQHGANWWNKLGLKKNPYVYGPMPWKRTSAHWRMEEARNNGWMAWCWKDGLKR